MKFGVINGPAEALLAFQFQERAPDGFPSEKARLGAYFLVQHYLMVRSFIQGGKE